MQLGALIDSNHTFCAIWLPTMSENIDANPNSHHVVCCVHDRSSGGNKGATLIRHASSNRVFRRKYGTIKRGKSMMALACDDDGGTGLRYFHYVEINEKDGSRIGAVLFTVHSARPSKSSRSNSIADVHRERSAIAALSPATKDAVRVRPLALHTFDVACRSCITQTLTAPSFGVYDCLPRPRQYSGQW